MKAKERRRLTHLCQAKIAYATREDAVRFLDSKRLSQMDVFPCSIGHHWHTGHPHNSHPERRGSVVS